MTSTSVAVSTSIGALVRQRAAQDPGHTALVVDGQTSLTVDEWVRRSDQVARALVARGVQPGDRIVIASGDAGWIEYAIGNLAIYLAGATAIGLSERLGTDTIMDRATQCQARAVVHTADVRDLRTGVRRWPIASLAQGATDEAQLPDPAEIDPAAIAEIVYTSGTTGPAKRVAVSHANLTFGRDSRGELFGGIESILCAVPAGTNAGHSALLVGLTTGSCAHVLSSAGPERIAAAIEANSIQHAILPPDAAAALVRSGAHTSYDLSSLRALMFGSSAVPDAVVSAFSEALPDVQIMIGYGSSESAPAFTRRSLPAWKEHGDPDFYRTVGLESLGRPGGGTDVQILGPDGTPASTGTVGEIVLRGEAPTRHYIAEDGGGFHDGWVRMGDLGLLDEGGELYFVDRVADSITSSGHQVSSAMVENAFMWHDAVRAAAVFAVPDDHAGQLAVAAVEVDGPADVEQLSAFLSDLLDPADRPAHIVVVASLPRGPLGKVLKRELRRTYAEIIRH